MTPTAIAICIIFAYYYTKLIFTVSMSWHCNNLKICPAILYRFRSRNCLPYIEWKVRGALTIFRHSVKFRCKTCVVLTIVSCQFIRPLIFSHLSWQLLNLIYQDWYRRLLAMLQRNCWMRFLENSAAHCCTWYIYSWLICVLIVVYLTNSNLYSRMWIS